MKNQLALFDLDGTLFDTRKINFLAYQKALKEYGTALDYFYYVTECNGHHYKEFLPQLVQDDGELELIHELKKKYYSEFLGEAVENTALFSLIEAIKKEYYIVLVTTASKKNCCELLHCFGRDGLFDCLITQESVEHVKPDPEGFFKAMEMFHKEAKNTIIFEDSAVGLQAAEATGATVFAVKGFA